MSMHIVPTPSATRARFRRVVGLLASFGWLLILGCSGHREPDQLPLSEEEMRRVALTGTSTSPRDAIEVAENLFPDGTTIEIELDAGDGESVYEVVIFDDDAVWKVTVDSATLEVLDTDEEFEHEEDVREAAEIVEGSKFDFLGEIELVEAEFDGFVVEAEVEDRGVMEIVVVTDEGTRLVQVEVETGDHLDEESLEESSESAESTHDENSESSDDDDDDDDDGDDDEESEESEEE